MFIIIALIEINKPKPIDWRETFVQSDKIPFGTYIAFDLLEDVFSENLKLNRKPVYNLLKEGGEGELENLEDNAEKGANFLFVNQYFNISETDSEELMNFVENGNIVFIAAEDFFFSEELDSILNIETDYGSFLGFNENKKDSTAVEIGNNFLDPSLAKENGFTVSKNGYRTHFTSFDTLKTQVLGTDPDDLPNLIKTNFGEGVFYLSTNPFAFTNYNMLYNENADYVSLLMSHLPNQTTYWDEYYKVGREEVKSVLRYFLSQEALRWALYLSVLSLFLFMFFDAKRKQRVIPIVKPPENSTLEFVETISDVYQNKGDHKDLAEKKIKYFFDYIRTKLYLKEINYNENFYEQLSNKSGVPLDEIKRTFNIIERIEKQNNIDGEHLLQINRVIDKFYSLVR